MTGNYGTFHKISFKREDLETMLANLNNKGYVNLVMNKRKTPSQHGQTHSLVIDTWQPSGGETYTNGTEPSAGQPPAPSAPTFDDKDMESDIPF